jgi:O-antigen ligase/tetratricopeptide (TPR) repeat protein
MARGEKEDVSSLPTRQATLAAFVRAAMEAVLLVLVCLSPWAYGTVHPGFELLLYIGIAVLLALWAARMLLEGQLTWKPSGVALCLAGLFLLGVWQRTPLPRPLLAWLSPGTARCYEQFLPQQPEVLPDEAGSSDAGPPPGSTLSLYAGATERESARLLALFLVFVAVLNNLATPEALIRLSWVALLNGVLLSVFALCQLFSAPAKTVYWLISTQATPFGPFINHNHFPDYINLCIGLGIGLLLSQSGSRSSSDAWEPNASPLQILRHPRTLWICGALGLMVCAVAFSRSRGGILALVGAASLCGIMGRQRLRRSFRLGSLVVVAGIVMALSAWFGMGLLKERMATLWSGEAYESRGPLWLRSLPIVPNFPIWGTGYGTFDYIEPMYRQDAPLAERELSFGHAHNDYLEILIEGGVIGLGLALLALLAVYRCGYRALTISRDRRRTGLALGVLFAFTAVALHCFTEFSTHIPAITLLATVVCAHLCALGQAKPQQARNVSKDKALLDTDKKDGDGVEYHLRLGGIAPFLGAMAVLGLGLLPCLGAWKAHRIDRLEEAAFRAGNDTADELRTRITYLSAAAPLGPQDASLHYELGFAHERLAELLTGGFFFDRKATRQQGLLALREYVRARDACPLLSDAQLGIAAYAARLEQGDEAADYLRRVKLLIPGQSEKWYLCGLREFTLGRFEDAWSSWRHCLEMSDHRLPQILSRAVPLSNRQLVDKVLPDNPEVLLTAAITLYPDFGSAERRRPFLEKALHLLEAKEAELGTQDLLIQARIYRALDQPDEAIQAYRERLSRDPFQASWRYELAYYLYEVRRLEEAHRELTVLLTQHPKNGEAKTLLSMVRHEMLQEKRQEREHQRPGGRLR